MIYIIYLFNFMIVFNQNTYLLFVVRKGIFKVLGHITMLQGQGKQRSIIHSLCNQLLFQVYVSWCRKL